MTQVKFEAHTKKMQFKKKKKGLSIIESIISGSVSGAFEVLVDHPL